MQTQPGFVNEFKEFFSFKGRIKRSMYIANIFIFLILLFCWVVAVSFLIPNEKFSFALFIPAGIAYFYMSICNSIKRFHDLDKSGTYVLWSLVPLVNIGFFIMLLINKGTKGPNKYGPESVFV